MATTGGKTSTSGVPRPGQDRGATCTPILARDLQTGDLGRDRRCRAWAGGRDLRREDLYSSLISEWRKQRDQGALRGLADRKPGPAATDPVRAELARLRAENAELRERVATQEELIGTQGKAFALLQQISAPSSATPSTSTPPR